MLLRKLTPCLLALALAFGRTREARAEPAGDLARARDLFLEGSRLAESGEWEAARDRFDRSLKLKRAALTLYNLGIAQQETGHLVDAVESFRAFLTLPVEPATQRYVEPVRAVVSMLEARVARVDVDVRPAGLRGLVVRIDGREVPPGSGPRMLDPGHHDVAASAPGFCEAHEATSLVEGDRATLSLRLAPGAPDPPGLALPVTLAAGGLGLLVGGGVVFGIGARHGLSSPGPGSAKLILAGNLVEGAGAVAIGAGLILLLTRTSSRPQKAAVTPWSSGSVGGVKVRF